MKRKIILGTIGLLTIFLFFWAYNHSFLDITVPVGGDTTYNLKDQTNDKTKTGTSTKNKVRVLVPRSSFEVVVKQGNQNYFTLTRTKGFLRTTRVTAQLQPEKAVRFIGDNPGSCMDLAQGVLVSYACGDFYGNASAHVPATPSTPTYALKKVNAGVYGRIQGLIQSQGKLLALIQHPIAEDVDAYYSMYTVHGDLSATDEVGLPDLDPKVSYAIRAYKDGFIIYDNSFTKLLYYASPSSKPEAIAVPKPKAQDVSLVKPVITDNSILALYTTSPDVKAAKAHSELVAVSNDRPIDVTLKKAYYDARLCGTNKLCVLQKTDLDIYAIGETTPQYLYSIHGVASIDSSASGFLAVRDGSVLNLDADTQSGFVEHDVGNYTFNALQLENKFYLMSLTNSKGGRVALLVDQQTPASDDIDKKIAALVKLPEVSKVSIYGNYIFISPNLGSLIYDASGNYAPDPTTQQTVNSKINQAIDKLGISRSAYTITITF